MPEEKTKLGNQTAPEKKSDAAKLPNAPPKTEKPPDKNDGIKPASAAEPQKTEDKSSTPPPAEVKKTDASGKDSRKDTVPTGDVKKPEASVKSPPAPAEAKKPATPANTPGKIGGKDTAPVSNAEKPGAAAKPLEKPAAKVIPEDSSKKPDGKTDAVIPPAATEAKKPDTLPAHGANIAIHSTGVQKLVPAAARPLLTMRIIAILMAHGQKRTIRSTSARKPAPLAAIPVMSMLTMWIPMVTGNVTPAELLFR